MNKEKINQMLQNQERNVENILSLMRITQKAIQASPGSSSLKDEYKRLENEKKMRENGIRELKGKTKIK